MTNSNQPAGNDQNPEYALDPPTAPASQEFFQPDPSTHPVGSDDDDTGGSNRVEVNRTGRGDRSSEQNSLADAEASTEEQSLVVPSDETEGPTAEQPMVPADDLEEMKLRWMRSVADLENMRKRMAREMDANRQRERINLLRSFVDVLDNYERAIASIDEALHKNLLTGLEAIHQQMMQVLSNYSATQISTMGETFDPRLHEAVGTAHLPDQEEGTIVEVIQHGYRLGENEVIRHSKVIVVRHES